MATGLFLAGILLGGVGVFWSTSLLSLFLSVADQERGLGLGILLVPAIGVTAGILSILGGIVARREARIAAGVLLVAGVLGTLGQTVLGLVRFGASGSLLGLFISTLIAGWWAIGVVLVGAAAVLASQRE